MQSAGSIGPSTGRPVPRRRETSDSLNFNNPLASPASTSRQSKDESQTSTTPASLVRRRTDLKDFGGLGEKSGEVDKSEGTYDTNSPFGSFKRTTTAPLSANINGPSSPWSTGPQSVGFPSTGAFGNFSLGGGTGQPSTPGDGKKLGFGSLRGESRFKGLMSKGSSEDMSAKNKEKPSIGNMEKLAEVEADAATNNNTHMRSFHQGGDFNPFDELDQHVGSAALGGDVPSPSHPYPFAQNQADQQRPHDDIGFSTFGTASDALSFRDTIHRRDYTQQTPQNPHYAALNPHEPMSPTNTNPYQSPEGDKQTADDVDADSSDALGMHANTYGAGPNAPRPFNAYNEGTASDRSQTSSAGPSRGFGGFGGLGGIGPAGAWSAAPGAVGTPSRVNPGYLSGFGDSISGLGDSQSPLYGGGVNPNHYGNIGSVGRGSKMGSLFPTAMQDQMRSNDPARSDQAYADIVQQRNPIGTGAPGFSHATRETDTPSRQKRGMLDDLFGNLDGRGRGSFPGADGTSVPFSQGPSSMALQASSATSMAGLPSTLAPSSSTLLGRSPEVDSSSSQVPPMQQRQMVMPDRMRWIYRDPQGNTQGPWSGLEMHDWYKAGFFSPELQVKKQEDADYEPLAQLIRRIGNSREPFLVPQIGIPHGSASTQPGANPSVLGAVPAITPSVQAGSAQPPFASSFPSFGTTLTAEQQNALERRKQEEQYLMARQKEHLAQQQVLIKQMQHMQGVSHGIHPQQLHHHSSAHSLQSQPSYGSITSPAGYQPVAPGQLQQHGSIPNFFDNQPKPSTLGMGPIGAIPENIQHTRELQMATSLERLNLGGTAQVPFGNTSQTFGLQEGPSHPQHVTAILQERARQQREQQEYDQFHAASIDNGYETMTRLEEYKRLRVQEDDSALSFQPPVVDQTVPHQSAEKKDQIAEYQKELEFHQQQQLQHNVELSMQQPTSLVSEQAPTTAKQSNAAQVQSPWATIEPGLPMPFPPPQSASPLPAPAAQRNRHNIADALAAESRSRSQTPSVDTPSATLAPWAKDNLESSKGPSLKEIQEAEARKTAQQEEIAAAARRALAEQERLNQAVAPQPTAGLPSSANWASSTSPATPTSGGPSAWAKPLAGKQPVPAAPTTKKTLAQIQKEEESRKNRVAAAAAANAANSLAGMPTLPGGKRYADLAGKVASPAISTGTGAWTTVGAGGKLKTPAGPSAPAPAPKAVSAGIVTSVAAVKPKPPVAPIRSNTAASAFSGQSANEELHKWAKGALGKGLNSNINGNYNFS
jgi:PERQ amino acid-rich with GYF domain-containing protein